MQLTKIKFLNFRRFRQVELDLNSGFTIIFGKNGAGKSSIIDAIGFCLFGAGNKDFSRGVTSDFKSYFIKERLPSKIELNFVYSGENYKVVRVIDAGIKKFENNFIEEREDTLIGPNSLKILGGTEITNFLVKLFGVGRDIFLKSVFTKQKDLGVLSGKKEDRKKLINSILGIDKIEKIIRDFSKQEYEKKVNLKILKQELENFPQEKINSLLKELKKEKKIFKQELEQEEKAFKKQQKDFLKVEKEYKKQSLIKKDFDQILAEISKQEIFIKNFKENISSYKKELENLKEKEKFLKQKNFLFEEYEKILKKLEKLKQDKILFEQKKSLEEEKKLQEKKLKEIDEKIKENRKKIITHPLAPSLNINRGGNKEEKILEKLKNTISEKIEKKNKDLKNELQEKASLEKELQLIKKEADEKKEAILDIEKIKDGECPTCKRKLGNYAEKFLETMNKDIEKLREKYGTFLKQKNIVEKNIKNFEKYIKELEQLNFKLEKIEKEIIRLEDLKKNFLDNLKNLEEKLNALEKIDFKKDEFDEISKQEKFLGEETKKLRILVGEIKKINSLEEKIKIEEKNLEKTLNEKKNLEKNLEKIDFKQEEFEKLKQEFENFSKIILEKTKKISSLKEKIVEFDKEIFSKNSLIEENKKTLEQKNKILKEIELLSLKQKIFSDYSIYLLNYLKPRIESLASNYFSVATDNKYSSISLDEEYRIKIDEKKFELYSGGEQDLANLCLRIALGQNLSITNTGNMINFLILDEVLGSQDKLRQQNILSALKKIETKFSQVILISHIDDLKDFGDNLIEVKAIDDLESEIEVY